ncbi:HAD-IA family hydrolase [Bradyrhizobium elkanii]|nr:HAD-IA family hydrolase [Bradyrhizobium elkanii]
MNSVCVLFDLDGTLVDSEAICNQALLDLLPDLNKPIGDLIKYYRGKKLSVIFNEIEASIGRRLPVDFEQAYRSRVSELFAIDLEPIPGVVTMLDSLSLPKCVVSNGPPHKIHQALKRTGIDGHFIGRVFSAYDVGLWKPDPGLLLHAARMMGAAPNRCAVVEDSEVGIEAALQAGMKAFQYVPDKDAGFHKDSVPFFEMSQLNSLLGQSLQ